MTIKVNVGSGPIHLNGWIEIDSSPNVILSKFSLLKSVLFRIGILSSDQMTQWDKEISWGKLSKLRFPDESIDFIYASHVLEHIYMSEATQVLGHLYSKLKKGGVLRICSPDYDAFIDNYTLLRVNDPVKAHSILENDLLSHPQDRPPFLKQISALGGSHIHYWHPTVPIMKSILAQTGFRNIRLENFRSGDFPDLEQIETREFFSFYLTAEK